MEYKLLLQRIYDDGDTTCGTLLDTTTNNKLEAFVLEDEFRKVKKSGETRIPAGEYGLGIRQDITPLTQKYLNDKRLKPWFERHIEVLDVPDFVGIYIHVGNDDSHSAGCLLLGDILRNINEYKTNPLQMSIQAYKRFYQKWYPRLKAGDTVKLIIFDEHKLLT